MTRKMLVGMLLLGALFIFGLATFYVENWQFYLGKGYRLTANFPVVQTLDEGDLVRMAGVSVGTVEDLKIETEEATKMPVEATLWIRSGVKVRGDDTATVRLASIFGGSYVSIERGDPTARELGDGDKIAKTDVSPGATEIIEQSKETLQEIQRAFEDVTAITVDLREGKGTLGRMLKEEEFYNNLDALMAETREAVETLKGATERINEGKGVLGRLIMDDELASDVDALVSNTTELTSNLREITEDLREGQGTFGKLLQSSELYDRLNQAVDTVSDVAALFRDGEGIVAKLLDDPEMAGDMRELFADAADAAINLKDITDKITSGENTIGKFLESDEAYEKLNASLDDLNEFTTALAEGKGTVGKLVTEDEAYRKITNLVDSVQGIVDTYREQSPVISFAGAVFGAF
jgi:phospholipid/cholesterol/gamma-HCH transport system substrate-binding protein